MTTARVFAILLVAVSAALTALESSAGPLGISPGTVQVLGQAAGVCGIALGLLPPIHQPDQAGAGTEQQIHVTHTVLPGSPLPVTTNGLSVSPPIVPFSPQDQTGADPLAVSAVSAAPLAQPPGTAGTSLPSQATAPGARTP